MPFDCITAMREEIAFWREGILGRIAMCGPEPEDFAAIEAEVLVFKRMSAALAWAISKGTSPR
jgi:hypothetical protein